MVITPGSAVPLKIQLPDGDTGKFPQAIVYDPTGAVLFGGPQDLTHVAGGFYLNIANVAPSIEGSYTAQYYIYDDAGHTIQSAVYGPTIAIDEIDILTFGSVNQIVGQQVDAAIDIESLA